MTKPKGLTKLTNLKVNEISLCRKGMNQEANVTLFKAAPDPVLKSDMEEEDGVEECSTCGKPSDACVCDKSAEKSCKDKKETPTEDVKMADNIKDVKKEVVEESIEVNGTTITKSVAGDGVFEVVKALQAETKVIKDALAKAQEEAVVEKAKREEAEFITKAEALFPSIPLDIEKKGKLLHEVSTKLSKESQDACMEVFKCAETLSADLVKEEKGSTSNKDASSDVMSRYDLLTKKYAEENHVSLSKARIEVMKTDEGKGLLKN